MKPQKPSLGLLNEGTVLFKWELKTWHGLSAPTFIFSIIYPLNNSRNFNQTLTKKQAHSSWDRMIIPSVSILLWVLSNSTGQRSHRFLYNDSGIVGNLKEALRVTCPFQASTIFSIWKILKNFHFQSIANECYKKKKKERIENPDLCPAFSRPLGSHQALPEGWVWHRVSCSLSSSVDAIYF